MLPRCFYLLLVLSAVACDAGRGILDETRTYSVIVPPFETAEACSAVTDAIFNCEPSITLCDNGGYILAVTDILNEGRYTIDGHDLIATQDGSGDGPTTIHAALTDETMKSSDLPYGTWKRRDTLDTDDCANLEQRTWW